MKTCMSPQDQLLLDSLKSKGSYQLGIANMFLELYLGMTCLALALDVAPVFPSPLLVQIYIDSYFQSQTGAKI